MMMSELKVSLHLFVSTMMDSSARRALNRAILTAASVGDDAAVEKELTQYLEEQDGTMSREEVLRPLEAALYAAAHEGRDSTVRLLVPKYFKVDEGAVAGYTPLYAAAASGHLSTVKLLESFGANRQHCCPPVRDPTNQENGGGILTGPSIAGHTHVIEYLCEPKVPVEGAVFSVGAHVQIHALVSKPEYNGKLATILPTKEKSEEGGGGGSASAPPPRYSVRLNESGVALKIKASNLAIAPPSKEDLQGALLVAAQHGRSAVCRMYIQDIGVDPNALSPLGCHASFQAAIGGHVPALLELAAGGADLDAPTTHTFGRPFRASQCVGNEQFPLSRSFPARRELTCALFDTLKAFEHDARKGREKQLWAEIVAADQLPAPRMLSDVSWLERPKGLRTDGPDASGREWRPLLPKSSDGNNDQPAPVPVSELPPSASYKRLDSSKGHKRPWRNLGWLPPLASWVPRLPYTRVLRAYAALGGEEVDRNPPETQAPQLRLLALVRGALRDEYNCEVALLHCSRRQPPEGDGDGSGGPQAAPPRLSICDLCSGSVPHVPLLIASFLLQVRGREARVYVKDLEKALLVSMGLDKGGLDIPTGMLGQNDKGAGCPSMGDSFPWDVLREPLALLGERVELRDLRAKPELNGARGSIKGFSEQNGRFTVDLGKAAGGCFKFKPGNFSLVGCSTWTRALRKARWVFEPENQQHPAVLEYKKSEQCSLRFGRIE